MKRKVITKQTEKHIIKLYRLNDDAAIELNYYCDSVNDEQLKFRAGTYLNYKISPNCISLQGAEYDAIASMIHYYCKAYQRKTEDRSFNNACSYVATELNCLSVWVKRILRGMAISPRWKELVTVYDRCGLDILELSDK